MAHLSSSMIPDKIVWKSRARWKPSRTSDPIKRVALIVPPYTVSGGTENVAKAIGEILYNKNLHVTTVATADFPAQHFSHVVLSPYRNCALSTVWYYDQMNEPVYVRYAGWEYYFQYYMEARDMLLALPGKERPEALVLMYSNKYDRMCLRHLAEVARVFKARACPIINTVFPQDPAQAGFWTPDLEPFAEDLSLFDWLGYSDTWAQSLPHYMRYRGSFDQPVDDRLFGQDVGGRRDIDVFCASTATRGKWLHGLIEACGRARVHLTLAALVPQDPEQQRYWDEQCVPRLHTYRRYVNYVGAVGHNEVLGMMLRSRLHVNPSLYAEPYGVVNREAGACGAPTLGFACGGFPDSIDDPETGVLMSLPEGVRNYKDLIYGSPIEGLLIETLRQYLEWCMVPGNLPDPASVQAATAQKSSYDAVGDRLLALIESVPVMR